MGPAQSHSTAHGLSLLRLEQRLPLSGGGHGGEELVVVLGIVYADRRDDVLIEDVRAVR
jgi:hypothetical protein